MLFAIPAQLSYPALGALVLGESAGLPLPGETALITAGGLVAVGHLALPAVIAVAALSAVAGDTLGYWLGRRKGRDFLLRGGFAARHRRKAISRADRFFAGYGTLTVFFMRFVPGLRVAGALAAGAAGMRWPRFAVANAAGALAWAATVATLSMAAGPTGSLLLALAGLTAGAALATLAWRRDRRRRAPVRAGAATGT